MADDGWIPVDIHALAACDIRYFRLHYSHCPTCGRCFAKMHPLANLYPHFIGACESPAAPTEDSHD